jgi:hypothetical protein
VFLKYALPDTSRQMHKYVRYTCMCICIIPISLYICMFAPLEVQFNVSPFCALFNSCMYLHVLGIFFSPENGYNDVVA